MMCSLQVIFLHTIAKNSTKIFMLYFNHIPRTGGTSLGILLKHAFVNSKKNVYEKSMPVLNPKEISGYDLIIGHMGTYPNTVINNLDTISIVRNPIDRLLSFYIHGSSWISKTEKYKDITKFEENLKYWLFDDELNNTKDNLQSKMICNNVDIDIINNLNKNTQSGVLDLASYIQNTQTIIWGVDTKTPDINTLNSSVENLSVFGTTENFEIFKNNLRKFLLEKYIIELKDNKTHPITANQSYRYINDKPYNVDILKKLLSSSEVKRLEEMNSVDMGVWENANRIK